MKKKIKKKRIVAIIGLGYVGLPLATELGKKFEVVGFDLNKNRINDLKKFKDANNEVTKKDLLKSKNLNFTNNVNNIKKCDTFIVTVPTPLTKNKKPDLTSLKVASKIVGKCIKKNDLIIFESTSYPGTTEDFCVPLLEKYSNLKFCRDFFVGYSPERINPGDKKNSLVNTSKVVSGCNAQTLNEVYKIYSSIIRSEIFRAKSIKIAEAAKIIENTQRDLNVALMNEFYLLFNKMNINIYDVLDAASTKWNFLKFTPGLVGGHCIGVDPYYLTYIARKNKYNPQIILAGRKINDSMPNRIYLDIKRYFLKKKIIEPKILILGATFKENCLDVRNSKSIELYYLLKKNKFFVNIFDPTIDKNIIYFKNFQLKKQLKKNFYDMIILTVGHTNFLKKGKKYFDRFGKKNYVFYDFKNTFGSFENLK